ncbi:MAG: DUF3298 and DUF4163 domain-containing protein [Treponema sp.]|nr:DUF3298 and DUF4163 domain-containing protein [Treponema sp.]
MKKKQFAALFSMVLFMACSGTPQVQNQNEPQYKQVNFSQTIPMFPDNPQSPSVKLTMTLLDASGLPEDTAFINEKLYQGKTPRQYQDDLIADWRQKYMANTDFASQNPVMDVFNWEYIETINYQLLKDQGMVVSREIYYYTGGAHGMGSTQYYVFDLAGHRQMTLNDFFRPDTDAQLYGMVTDGLRSYNNSLGDVTLSDTQGLSAGIFFDDKPAMTDNFFITSDGLGLNWAPIVIAPYAYGSIEIVLPWATVRPLLQNDAMELLEKFGIPMFM